MNEPRFDDLISVLVEVQKTELSHNFRVKDNYGNKILMAVLSITNHNT
jgi:hypothetical protein